MSTKKFWASILTALGIRKNAVKVDNPQEKNRVIYVEKKLLKDTRTFITMKIRDGKFAGFSAHSSFYDERWQPGPHKDLIFDGEVPQDIYDEIIKRGNWVYPMSVDLDNFVSELWKQVDFYGLDFSA